MPSFQIFTPAEQDSLRRAGKILKECLAYVGSKTQPGLTTLDLDALAEEFIRSHDGAIPAFKGFNGFPGTLCTSVNEQCVHGIPSKRILKEGDIVSLDGGVMVDDLYTDACITVPVGSVSPQARELLSVTKNALDKAISVIRPGARVGDISSAVQKVVEKAGFSPIRALTGHGLGKALHQFPDIPNVGKPGTGPVLPAYTLIAVEPIVAVGSHQIVEDRDGWTIATVDRSLSAHFEHTILLTESGCEVLTA